MGKRRKNRPPPNPDDFDEPNTTGWHTLTDSGWVLNVHTADWPVPNDPLIGKHAEFAAKHNDVEYKFRLCDGTGRQVNLETETSRICKWFENGASIASAASVSHPSEAQRWLELAEENRQLARQLALYRAKWAQLHAIFEFYGWDVSILQFQEAIADGEPPPAPRSTASSSMSDAKNPQVPPPPPYPDGSFVF